jgi:alkylation response protein AidB-like acyl-CoA dehydrogenase
MDFAFTADQEKARNKAREFLDKEIAPIANKRDQEGPLSREEVVEFARKLEPLELGFTTFKNIRRHFKDPLTYFMLREELSRVWCSLVAAISWSLPAMAIIVAPTELREKLLPRLNEGNLIGSIALTEPGAGSDTRILQTKVTLSGGSYTINGTKTWITNASIADVLVVLAKDKSGNRQLILVDKESSPFQAREMHKLGLRACPMGEIYFDDCKVPKECNVMNRLKELISSGELADLTEEFDVVMGDLPAELLKLPILHLLFTILHVDIAAMGAGLCSAAFDASVAYAKQRTQFKKSIASFQMVQNRIYDMLSLTEASRLLTYRVADALRRGEEGVRWKADLAMAFATEAANKVTYDAIQIHGGIGLSGEYPLERYYRDARMLTIAGGATDIQKLVVGREILGVSALV